MKKLIGLFVLVFPLSIMAQNLYDIDNITTINIEFSESDWDGILDTYYANGLDERLAATVTVNGVVYDSAGVKFKGNSTYSAANNKNPINIKLDDVYDIAYQGYTTLKLSNGKKDPSFIREVLSYEIGRKYMDMPLSNYAYVTINGTEYGLFSSSESINGDYVERRFYSDRDNARFKCNPNYGFGIPSLEYLGADSSFYFDSYELKTDFGWEAMVQLCSQIQTDIYGIEDFIDVDAALWMLAFDNVLVNLDSYIGPLQQNYYLIKDDFGRFVPVVWDLNQSIGSFSALVSSGGGPPSPTSLTDLTEMEIYLRQSDNTYPLIFYLFQVPRYKKMYLAHLKTLYEENLALDQYYTRGLEIQEYISSTVASDPNAVYSLTEFSNNIDNSVGTGMKSTYGIQQVLDARKDFLGTSAEFALIDPTITTVAHAPVTPSAGETITVTANIVDGSYAYLGYRNSIYGPFTKLEMFDDGTHGDGAAGDDVYGIVFAAGSSDIQYYVYAENVDAGKFSPVRAEHEFYNISLSAGLVINEIMVKNNGTVADQDNEYDDWVEFYNNAASAIDLSGYHFSDNPLILDKFEFPSETTLGAGEYLIVWCDQDTLQEGLHANFKLSSDGETLILSDASLSPINEVYYPEMEHGTTFGRYVNGTGAFQRLMPTYAAANSFTNIGVEEIAVIELTVFPNPTQNSFFINGINESQNIVLFDMSGKQVYASTIAPNESKDISFLNPGIYIIQLPEIGKVVKVIKN